MDAERAVAATAGEASSGCGRGHPARHGCRAELGWVGGA